MAPVNTNPRCPQGHFQLLEALGLEKQQHSLQAYRVRRFFNQFQRNRRRRDLGRTEIEAFLQRLTSDPDATNWQVKQALDTLKIYQEQFRAISPSPLPDDAPAINATGACRLPGPVSFECGERQTRKTCLALDDIFEIK